ncbi:extracellular solute-binding protein [Petralouisia muris]|uniref:Extracellular solute-binding protein n=1 Tax=Petralouisia muris TaxID=3032872 RepID=A0AC61RXF9_9FIRM|nr:extracellular solute-binding protein [Petralouisia muris]TGY96550.1 extracellular solute-binding protein [Petralouisia muris]
MAKRKKRVMALFLAMIIVSGLLLSGCGKEDDADGKVVIELVHYKPEAVDVFEALEEKFNATHDNIKLVIDSPNDAMVILKTRFIRENNPDIIGIGGDINYSNFLDANMLMDISDFDGLADIKDNYLSTNKDLEYVPQDGVYAVPYMANAAGVLYNKDMFEEHGWTIPTTWEEFNQLCETIAAEGIQPLYFGYKDTWTCLAPWNAIAVNLCDTDIAYQVNSGNAKFSEAYEEIAVKTKELLKYGQSDPVAYSYNDACTAFARGQAAMYTIGSYAIPQIKSVNPDMNIDSFVFPASSNAEENILNSGNDLMFCVMEDCEHKEEVYEVLRFLLEDENVQDYVNDQSAVPCKKGEFEIAAELTGMKEYIDNGIIADYQDHHYPNEMAVDAMIQTYLFDDSSNALETFLTRFDNEWVRYNRDIIAKVQEYQEKGE